MAHHSGQTLAGLFLLRTLVEQFAREATCSHARNADELMDEYMATLPEAFRGTSPSMRSLYDELSAAMHGAVASQELFEDAVRRIDEHFRARDLFKLKIQTMGTSGSAMPPARPDPG